MEKEPTINIAAWVANLSYQLNNLDDWLDLLESQCQRASAENSHYLLVPEHIAAMWLKFAPKDLSANQEISWMADQAELIMAPIQSLATKYQLNIVAGSWPYKVANAKEQKKHYTNRAILFTADGRFLTYDKLCLTPEEKDCNGWDLIPGDSISIINIDGFKVAMIICLDSELASLSAKLATLDIDLLLIPSMTSNLAGFSRVNNCAKARAIELFVPVCVVGCVANENNPFTCVGGAAVYLPCEKDFVMDGIFGQFIAPAKQYLATDEGELIYIKAIPVGQIKNLRKQGKVDVWPGAWDASHVLINEVS